MAVVRRDALVAASYPIPNVLTVIAGLFSLWMLYYLGRVFGGRPAMQPYGGDYFRFAVIGTALASVARGGLAAIAHKVRESQLDGSLAFMLGTPARPSLVLASLALYPLGASFVGSAAFLAGAALFFGADFSSASFLPAAVAALAGVVASLGFGLAASAFVILVRRSDPFSWLLESLSFLLSGVLYPVEALPLLLQRVAQLLPATHAIAAVRASLVHGATLSDIAPHLLALAVIAAVALPLGMLAVRLALARAERDGTLGQS